MKLYQIHVNTHDEVWRPVGQTYASKRTAKSWLRFVKAAWHGRPTLVRQVERDMRLVELMRGESEASA